MCSISGITQTLEIPSSTSLDSRQTFPTPQKGEKKSSISYSAVAQHFERWPPSSATDSVTRVQILTIDLRSGRHRIKVYSTCSTIVALGQDARQCTVTVSLPSCTKPPGPHVGLMCTVNCMAVFIRCTERIMAPTDGRSCYDTRLASGGFGCSRTAALRCEWGNIADSLSTEHSYDSVPVLHFWSKPSTKHSFLPSFIHSLIPSFLHSFIPDFTQNARLFPSLGLINVDRHRWNVSSSPFL